MNGKITVLGIDPGCSNGFLCKMDEKLSYDVYKMPDTPKSILELISKMDVDHCFIENVTVNACPFSPARAAKLMMNKANCEMACLANGIPITWVTPSIWQKKFQCLTGGDKKITKKRAQELFPSEKYTVTQTNADSIIIAGFGIKELLQGKFVPKELLIVK